MTTQAKAPRTRYRFTADQYEAMIRTGILTKDDRVELIDGEVLDMPPIGQGHVSSVMRIHHWLGRLFGDVALVLVQAPVRLGAGAMPEPDIALLHPRADFYRADRAGPADIYLIVEVADTSLTYGRTTKARLYARAGIPEYWLHDVNKNTLTVFRDPTPEGYRSERTLKPGDQISLAAFPDRTIAVSELLGEAS